MSESDREGRRLAYLRAMGVEVFVRKQGRGPGAEGPGAGYQVDRPDDLVVPPAAKPVQGSTGAVPSMAPPRRSAPGPRPSEGPSARGAGSSLWDELQDQVANCRACDLCQSRTQTVFGVGNRDADLMIIGEAPGADEDRQGEPFVGRAGQLLTAMLRAIGLAREDVFIANILKCRPPGNRNPTPEEAAACQGFLQRQIDLVKPRLILSVGAVSAHNLLGTDEAVGRLRRREHRYEPGDIPLLVTYHPAYLLRRPGEKAKAWGDLQQAWRLLR